jgi:hypothetical protein
MTLYYNGRDLFCIVIIKNLHRIAKWKRLFLNPEEMTTTNNLEKYYEAIGSVTTDLVLNGCVVKLELMILLVQRQLLPVGDLLGRKLE